jgi:hypothetical protein
MRADLELLDERRFGNGVVHLRYRPLGRRSSAMSGSPALA